MTSQDLGTISQDTAATVVNAASQPMTRKSRVQEIKADIWTRYSWDVMLAAAPIALELLGSCQVIASTPKARGIKLKEPKRGFQYLRGYTYLATALREVSEQGRSAFESGRQNMNEIRENSEKTRESVMNIWDYLKETDTDPELYEIQLANLEETSNTCKECAEKMQADFATWLNFVSELHVTCQDSSSQAEADFRTFESKEKANEILRVQQDKLVTKAEETMKKFETQMTEQNDKYKDLMNKYPDGNALLKQQLTMLAAETVAQVVQIGVTAAACSASPMAAVGLAAKGASDASSAVKNAQGGADTTKKADATPATGEAAAVIDPALARCEPVKNAINNLKQLLKGGEGGTVDWDFMTGGGGAKADQAASKEEAATNGESSAKDPAEPAPSDADAKAEDPKEAPVKKEGPKKEAKVNSTPASSANKDKLQLDTVVILLQAEKDGLDGAEEEKTSDVGKQLLPVLTSAITVSTAIQKEVETAISSTEWKQPAKDNASVKAWISKVESAATIMVKLSAQSASRPGAPNGRVPVVVTDPAAKEKVKARSDLNRDTVDAARSQLEISQKGLANTQNMFFQASNKVLEVQEKLDKIRADIKQLAEDKDTLNAVRDVLRSCIAFLGDLMDKISELVRFFSTIATLIRSAVKNAVTPYRKTLAVATKQLAAGTNYLSISMCNTIQQYSISIAASFSLYEDIGKLYVKINDDHLIKGITLVRSMGNDDGRTMDMKQADLSKYAKEAAAGIKADVKAAGDKIISGVNDRLATLDNVLQPLPPLEEKTRKAIDAGADVIQKERVKELENKNPGVDLIAKPREERKAAAASLARAISEDDEY